jgi:flavin-binding protein dodecin
MSVYKKIVLIGTSEKNFEAAVDNALDRADYTIDNIHWAEVQDMGVEMASVSGREYQVEVEVAFELE